MRLIVNTILGLISIGLVYLLIVSIKEPIQFGEARNTREKAIIDRLRILRDLQNMHLDIKGQFAKNWDDLKNVLTTEKFMYINIEGDPDDPNFTDFKRDTSYAPAIDTIKAMSINLDSVSLVPFSNGVKFDIFADTIQYQGALQNVVEVGTTYKTFMGKYGDVKYSKYDNSYNPEKFIKFGDRSTPIVTGNWEK